MLAGFADHRSAGRSSLVLSFIASVWQVFICVKHSSNWLERLSTVFSITLQGVRQHSQWIVFRLAPSVCCHVSPHTFQLGCFGMNAFCECVCHWVDLAYRSHMPAFKCVLMENDLVMPGKSCAQASCPELTVTRAAPVSNFPPDFTSFEIFRADIHTLVTGHSEVKRSSWSFRMLHDSEILHIHPAVQ